jgi:hypothetical protein
MIDVTTKDLLAKIGALVMENDALRGVIAEQRSAAPAAESDADPALRPGERRP